MAGALIAVIRGEVVLGAALRRGVQGSAGGFAPMVYPLDRGMAAFGLAEHPLRTPGHPGGQGAEPGTVHAGAGAVR